MVDVMEYLRLYTVVSLDLRQSGKVKHTRQELHCCVQWSRRREKLIENNPLVHYQLLINRLARRS